MLTETNNLICGRNWFTWTVLSTLFFYTISIQSCAIFSEQPYLLISSYLTITIYLSLPCKRLSWIYTIQYSVLIHWSQSFLSWNDIHDNKSNLLFFQCCTILWIICVLCLPWTCTVVYLGGTCQTSWDRWRWCG